MNELINLGNGQFVKITMLKGEAGSNIATITKTGTSGLTDTYTVTLTDGSHTSFEVKNGRSIVSIAKTGSYLLTDTYTITYNDGTTSTFTVENGGNSEELNVYHATGDSLALVDTVEGNALAKTIYGMSTQNGTPTPSSPVEIKSAKADFKVRNKNLITIPISPSTATKVGITITQQNDGSYNFSGTNNTGAGGYALELQPTTAQRLYLKAGHKYSLVSNRAYATGTGANNFNVITVIRKSNNETYQLTLSATALGLHEYTASDGDYISSFVQLWVPSGASLNVNNIWFMFLDTTEGSVNTDYEPQKEIQQSTDLTLRAIEVTSSDAYNLVKDGKYYIADTLDWSEDEGFVVTRRVEHFHLEAVNYFQDRGNNLKQINVALPKKSKFLSKGYSNRFKVNTSITRSSGDFYIDNTGSTTHIWVGFVESTDITNTTTGTTWLSNNETYVDYVLADSAVYTEHITPEQALSLLSLKTYDVATSIDGTGDVAPVIELHYAKNETVARALTGHNEGFKAQELNNLYGVKNLIPYPYYETTKTYNGLTFTDNGDGTVTVNGTATATSFFYFVGNSSAQSGFKLKGEYIASCENASDNCKFRIGVTGGAYNDITNKAIIHFDVEHDIYLCLRIANGASFSNVTMRPMLRLASIQSDEYEQYAMSNLELTKAIQNINTSLSEILADYIKKSELTMTVSGGDLNITKSY